MVGGQVELIAEIDPGYAERVDLTVHGTGGAAAQTQITYDCASHRIVTDQRQASNATAREHDVHTGVPDLTANEPLPASTSFLIARWFEVFVNERVTLTNRIYGLQPDQLQIELVAHGGEARLITLDAWVLDGIWPDG